MTLAGGAYAWRLRDLRRTPAPRSGDMPAHDALRALAFAGGLLVVLLALVSPIDRLGEERLFTAHMVQHLLLADLAPILLLRRAQPRVPAAGGAAAAAGRGAARAARPSGRGAGRSTSA